MDRRKTDRRRGADSEISVPDIGEILHVLYKRKLIVFLLTFIPVGLGFLYIKNIPDTYMAKTSVILENKNLNVADFDDVLGGVQFDDLTVPTQIEMITSAPLSRETISVLGMHFNETDNLVLAKKQYRSNAADSTVDYEVLKEFQGNLKAKQQGSSRIIEVSFLSQAPEYAAKIVNTHAKNYVFSQLRAKKQQAETVNQWISKQIVSLKKESLNKSRAVQKFKSDNGMIQGMNSQDLIYQQISDIARQLSPIETQELDLQARVELLNSGQSGATKEVIESQLIQSLKSRASVSAQKVQSLSADLGQNHPNVIAAKNEYTQIKTDIANEITNIKRSIKNELTTIKKQKELLESKLSDLQRAADSLQENQVTLQALEREEAASQKLLDNFLERSEEIGSQVDFTRPDVRIVAFADIPGEPSGSKKKLLLVVLLMASILFSLGVVFLIEILNTGLNKIDDVKQILNIKLLGTLPKERKPLSSILNKQRTLYVEEIKRIYIHLRAIEGAQAILFTSARIGEGKSITAIAIAYYLSVIGKKTILVDANTVTPQTAKISETRTTPGFYDILAGTHKIDDVIVTNDVGIDVIPAGEQISFSSDLLVSGRFEAPLAELRKKYDYIIIDSASALETSDAQILSRLADETVIVAAWSKTPKKLLKLACEIVREMSSSTPHIILNKMPMKELQNK